MSIFEQILNGISIFTLESILPPADINGTNIFYKTTIVITSAISALILLVDIIMVTRSSRLREKQSRKD